MGPLSENIYPSIYLKKIELQGVPDKFESLEYPSIVDYDLKFGDNFSYQLYNNRATYKFSGYTREPKTYYTVTVYQNTYGLTDLQKPDFKLTVTTREVIRLTESNPTTPTARAAHEPEQLELLTV